MLLGVTGFVTPFPARFPYSIKFMAGNSPSPATFALIAAFFIFLGVSPPWPPGQKSAGQVPRGGPGYPLQLPGQKSAGRAIPLLSLTQKHPNPKVLPFIRDRTSRRRRRVPQGQAPSAAGPRSDCCPPPSPTARPAPRPRCRGYRGCCRYRYFFPCSGHRAAGPGAVASAFKGFPSFPRRPGRIRGGGAAANSAAFRTPAEAAAALTVLSPIDFPAPAVTAPRARPRKNTADWPGSAGAGPPSLRSGGPPAPAGGHGLRAQLYLSPLMEVQIRA